MEWRSYVRGDAVCVQGAPSDALYVLVSGRAVAVYRDTATGAVQVVGEIGQNELIGEMGLLTGEPRSISVICARDSELLRLDRQHFEQFVATHPRVLLAISQTVIERLRQRTVENRRPSSGRVTTVALIPAGGDDGRLLPPLAMSLAAALGRHGTTRHVSHAHLPPEIRDDTHDSHLVAWLNDLELSNRFLVLEADPVPSPWTERCLRHADRLLLVARPDSPSEPGPLEHQAAELSTGVTAVQKDLVLVQRSSDRLPAGTGRWLDVRLGRVQRHHHVHLGTPATIDRLARFIAGRAVGLALGGGGARGFAHVGAIRALREAGVPLDVIVGTSMGALIGAECALGWPEAEIHRRNRASFIDQHPLWDYTLPVVAAHSGRGVARALRGLFDDVQIEDLWSTYVVVCSNLTRGTVTTHARGPVRKYVRASISVPGLLPPVTDGGELLVDGGVLNNLPADIARDLVGTGAVIAVDVNPRAGLRASEDYGEVLDGWELVWRRLSPTARPLAMPGIHDLLERMTMLGSIQQAAQSVQTAADLYLHPPTDMVRFLDFSAMEVHAQRGYDFARPLVRAWAERTGYAGTPASSAG